MSERIIAERHEFTTARGNEAAVAFDPQCPDHPDLFGPCTEVDLRLEILRVVAEREEACRQLLERRAAHEADNARLVQERDEARLRHRCSEGTLAMTVARLGGEVEGHPTHRINFLQRVDELRHIEAQRDALGKALLRYVVGDDCGCSDGSPDQPPAKQCAFCEAQIALRGAGLLPEEES